MLRAFFCLVIVSWLLVLSLCGCGGDPVVTSITVSPATPSIGINRTQQFTAAAYDAAGTQVTATFTWSVVGSGSISSSGLFTAGSTTGTATIQATSGSITGSTVASIVGTGSISGTITNSSGNNVSGITVSLTSMPTLYATSSGTGTYTISAVPKGTWEVRTSASVLYIITTKEVTVVTGEAANGNIALSDRFTVTSQTITPSLISGIAKNNGTGEATGVTVTYALYDSYGDYMGGGLGTIGSMASGESKTFAATIIPSVSNYVTVNRTFAASTY